MTIGVPEGMVGEYTEVLCAGRPAGGVTIKEPVTRRRPGQAGGKTSKATAADSWHRGKLRNHQAAWRLHLRQAMRPMALVWGPL